MTTTGNMKLFQPAAADFVDVNRDVNTQLIQIDTFCYPLLNYRYSLLDWASMPPGLNQAEKRFSAWDSSIRTWEQGSSSPDPSIILWLESQSIGAAQDEEAVGWTLLDPALMIAPYISSPTFPVYYRFTASNPQSPEGRFQFRGRVQNATGFAAIPARTTVAIMNMPVNCALLGANTDALQISCGRGGLPTADQYQYNRLYVDGSNVMQAARIPCGNNAATQTAGDANNYYQLDGFVVRGVRF